jgi:hypothetical protein
MTPRLRYIAATSAMYGAMGNGRALDNALRQAMAYERQIIAVIELHQAVTARRAFYGDKDARECVECGQAWPCKTRRALDGPTTSDSGPEAS